MRIHHLSTLAILGLLAVHSAPASDWEIVASSNAGRQANSLSSVASVADNDVWAVGWAFNAQLNAYRTVTEHWNGTRWSLVRSPNATTGYNLLNAVGVVAANDVWAVGQAAIGSTYSTMIQHWNGTSWNIVSSPNVAGFSNVLQAITVVSANDIWAVGYSQDTNFNTFTLTLHWNGAAWSIVPSPNDGGNNVGNHLLAAAAVSANDVWAVGFSEFGTLSEHWNGSAWSVVPTPEIANTEPLFLPSVVALSSNNVWSVGESFQSRRSLSRTLTEQWNGTQWTVVKSPNVGSDHNELFAIDATPGGTLWAVGTVYHFPQQRTLIERKLP